VVSGASFTAKTIGAGLVAYGKRAFAVPVQPFAADPN